MRDAAGRQMTDARLAAMIHQAFLLGALYELDRYGQITTRLFEDLNTRLTARRARTSSCLFFYGRFPKTGRSGSFRPGSPAQGEAPMAREICEAILDDMLTFSAPADDITLVIVKRR